MPVEILQEKDTDKGNLKPEALYTDGWVLLLVVPTQQWFLTMVDNTVTQCERNDVLPTSSASYLTPFPSPFPFLFFLFLPLFLLGNKAVVGKNRLNFQGGK